MVACFCAICLLLGGWLYFCPDSFRMVIERS